MRSDSETASQRRYKLYPRYKDSGVEWLGELPAHWAVKRLWHLTPLHRRIMYGIVLPGPSVPEGVPIVKGGDVSPDRLRLDKLNRTTFEIESGYVRSRLRGGDLVYAIRGSIGEVAIVPDELQGANLTQDAARIAYTPATCGPWLLNVLRSAAVFAQLEGGSLGATIRGVNIRDLKRATLPVPPQPEQVAIASFLERETASVDALKAKKQRLIELLQEKRSALITQAVTKGLDPSVPLKDSGVGWLGEIPAHWSLVRLKRCLTRIEQGWSPLAEQRQAAPEEWAVLKVGCVNGGVFSETEHKALSADTEPFPELEIRDGDLLMSRANTTELLGSAAVADSPRPHLLLCDKLYRLSVASHQATPRFIAVLLASQSARYQLEIEATGASNSMQNIGQETVSSLLVPLPPLGEQAAILRFLDRGIAEISSLIAKSHAAIDLLKEYRVSLISAAVTGKIDVRDEIDRPSVVPLQP